MSFKLSDVQRVLSLQFSLMAAFPENILGILLFCGCVMVMGVIQVRQLNCFIPVLLEKDCHLELISKSSQTSHNPVFI